MAFLGNLFQLDPGMSMPSGVDSPWQDPSYQKNARNNALLQLGLGLMAAGGNSQGLGAGLQQAFVGAQGSYQGAMENAYKHTLLKQRLDLEQQERDRLAKLQQRQDRESAAVTAGRISAALQSPQYQANPSTYWDLVKSNPDVQAAVQGAGAQLPATGTPDFSALTQRLGAFAQASGPAPAAPPTTDDIKEYGLAKSQGFTGSFFDYLKQVKAAGAPQITPPTGYRYNPDGTLSAITGGPADPNIKPPKAPSEADKKASVLLQGMNDAETQLSAVTGTDTSSYLNKFAGWLPGGGMLQSDDYRRYKAAADRWASNYLYLKSGAQAGKDEIATTVGQFFPQPGDGPDVIAQKNAARAQEASSIASIYTTPTPSAPGPKTPAPTAAIDYLKAHPEAREQFKAKYGYVP